MFHSLEAAFAYLRAAVRLSPNSCLQVKLCIFFPCFPVGYFFPILLILLCSLEPLWFIKMGCDGSLESGYGISESCHHCVWKEGVAAILGGISSYSQTHTHPVQFAYFRRLWQWNPWLPAIFRSSPALKSTVCYYSKLHPSLCSCSYRYWLHFLFIDLFYFHFEEILLNSTSALKFFFTPSWVICKIKQWCGIAATSSWCHIHVHSAIFVCIGQTVSLLSLGLLLMDLLQLLIPLFLLQMCLLWASQVPNVIGRVALVKSETSIICKRWDGNELWDYILVFHRRKMGWKSDFAVIPFSFRFICLAGSLPSLLHTHSTEGAEGRAVEALIMWKHCSGKMWNFISIVLVTDLIHRCALCYWQIVTGPPLSRSFERLGWSYLPWVLAVIYSQLGWI